MEPILIFRAAADDDDAIAAFFQEVKQETGSAHVIRKVSGFQDLDVIRLGPDVSRLTFHLGIYGCIILKL